MKPYETKDKIKNYLMVILLGGYISKANKIKTPQEKKILEFYRSIIYRTESLVFHVELIQKQIDIVKYSLDKSQKARLLQSKEAYDKVYYLFDDLIFNMSSVFDYIANLVGYFYIGQGKQNIKWNGIVRYLRDSNNLFSNDSLKECILQANKIFINDLYGYRSDLIHTKRDKSDVLHSIDNTNQENVLVISVPDYFQKTLKVIECENKDIYIASKCLVYECLNSLFRIIESVYLDSTINLVRKNEEIEVIKTISKVFKASI